MKIAVTYEEGQIFQHFGHTKQFKVYEVENSAITGTSIIDAGESGHGALAGLLEAGGIDTLICGGIGDGAKRALATAGITLYGGVAGGTDQAVNDLLANRLVFNPEVKCNHHGEHHHGDHQCGGECSH